jgi:predicted DNA-binding transcriptional regulator AlpA
MESAMSSFIIGREMARESLGVTDAELNQLIRERELPPPVLDSAGRERFHAAEISAYRERRWAMRARSRKGIES